VDDLDLPPPLSVLVLTGAFVVGCILLSPVGFALGTVVWAVRRWR
jgi:hypothetical protein